MTEEEMRDEFEAWAAQYAELNNYRFMEHLLKRDPKTGDYSTTWVDSAWIGWKASCAGRSSRTANTH